MKIKRPKYIQKIGCTYDKHTGDIRCRPYYAPADSVKLQIYEIINKLLKLINGDKSSR